MLLLRGRNRHGNSEREEEGREKGEGRYLPLDICVSLKFLNFVETVENNQEQ